MVDFVKSCKYTIGRGFQKVTRCGELCEKCKGTGWISDPKKPHPCLDCNGKGLIKVLEERIQND